MDEMGLSNILGSLIQRDNDGLGGNNGIWFIFLLFLFFGGFGGGWGANRGACATTQDVAQAFNANQVDNGQRAIGNGLASLGYDNLAQFNNTNMMMQGGFNNVAQAIAQAGFNMQSCCCETNRNIDALRFNTAQEACGINRNIDAARNDMERNTGIIVNTSTANTQRVLDAICQLRSDAKDAEIAQLRSDLQSAQLTLGNAAQTQSIVAALKPQPVPAYITASPYASYYGGTTIT